MDLLAPAGGGGRPTAPTTLRYGPGSGVLVSVSFHILSGGTGPEYLQGLSHGFFALLHRAGCRKSEGYDGVGAGGIWREFGGICSGNFFEKLHCI